MPDRDGERGATLGYEERNVRPDTDFKVLFSRAKADVGVDLLTYRNGPDDGYFLLMASPGFAQAAAAKIQRRDVCFVIDTSGSMAEAGGKKMEQAKKALSFCLQNLNDGDRFEVIRFSTEAETLFGELNPVDKANVDKAVQDGVLTKEQGDQLYGALSTGVDAFVDSGLSFKLGPGPRGFRFDFHLDDDGTPQGSRSEDDVPAAPQVF